MYNVSSKYKIIFLIFDIFSIIIGIKFSTVIFSFDYSFVGNTYFLFLLILLTFILNVFTEEYRYIEVRGYLKEFKYSLIYSLKILVVLCFILILNKTNYIDDLIKINFKYLFCSFFTLLVVSYFFRIFAKFLLKQIKEDKKNALFLSNFECINVLENEINKNYNLLAYVNFNYKLDTFNNKVVLKNLEEVRYFIINHRVDEIFLSASCYSQFEELLKDLKLIGVPTSINISDFSSNYVGESLIKNIGALTFITSAVKVVTLRQIFLKRLMDISGAIIGIIFTFIVALIIYPKVQKESKGPLIFKQKRVGKNGQPFYIYKFRSMYLDAEERKKELMSQNDLDTTLMFKMKDDPRIFPFGQKLRDWSIDELPQFINVLKGDMSLVGTRPPTLEEYKQYEFHHFKRLAVKPGITGLWQVSGRSNIEDFEKVVELDLKYIQEWSISMDIKILFKTLKVVLKREGSR